MEASESLAPRVRCEVSKELTLQSKLVEGAHGTSRECGKDGLTGDFGSWEFEKLFSQPVLLT